MESDEPLINTGVLSQSPAQFSQLWAIREGITEAVSKEGKAYKYDISIPVHSFKDVVDATREQLKSKGLLRPDAVKEVIGYGHVGDGTWHDRGLGHKSHEQCLAGNLHLNIVAAQYSPEIEAALEPFVYELVGAYRTHQSCRRLVLIPPHSVVQGLRFCGTRYRSHEDTRIALLEERDLDRPHEADKGAVRSQGHYEPRKGLGITHARLAHDSAVHLLWTLNGTSRARYMSHRRASLVQPGPEAVTRWEALPRPSGDADEFCCRHGPCLATLRCAQTPRSFHPLTLDVRSSGAPCLIRAPSEGRMCASC